MKKTNQKQYAASRAHVWAFCEPSEDLTRAAKNPFRRQSAEQAEGVAIHAAIHAHFLFFFLVLRIKVRAK